MARKTKKKTNRMPPLSFVDKVVYSVTCILIIAAAIALFVFYIHARDAIAFEDGNVVAARETVGILWVLPLWFYLFMLLFIPWAKWYEAKRPIFGIRGFQYGPPKWANVYPLFMKNKPYEWVSENAKKNRKFNRKLGALLLLTLFVLVYIPFPFSLFGRECLREDYSISRYNGVNGEIESYDAEDIQTVTLARALHRSGRYGRFQRTVKVVFQMADGAQYSFISYDFSGEDEADVRFWLAEMLRIKEHFGAEKIIVQEYADIGLVINDQSLNEKEAALLYELFSEP